MSLIIFFIILAVLVLIHEFGHFIAAKKSGVLVEEFGFGYPPRIWGIKIGETLYSINLIPLGGFVKLYGEEYDEIKKSQDKIQKNRTFSYKKPQYKALIVISGIMMNLILGVGIYYFLLSANNFQSDPLPLLAPYHFRFGTQQGRVIATDVIKNSPADKAGITTEDIVLRFKVDADNNQWITIYSGQQLIDTIKNKPNISVLVDIQNIRNGNRRIVRAVPYYNKELKRAIIGVNLIDSVVLTYNTPVQKIFSGFMHSYNIVVYNVKTIAQIFQYSIKEKSFKPVSQTVSGPIGIFQVINDVVKSSGKKLVTNILNITALLSLSLAITNLLPFPALDGGRLIFVMYEWITHRQINKTVEKYVNLVGFFLLLSLALLISINDIVRMFK